MKTMSAADYAAPSISKRGTVRLIAQFRLELKNGKVEHCGYPITADTREERARAFEAVSKFHAENTRKVVLLSIAKEERR